MEKQMEMQQEYTHLAEKPEHVTITPETPYSLTGPKLFWSNAEIPLPNIGDEVRAEGMGAAVEGVVTGYFECLNYVGIFLDNGADVFGAEVVFAAPTV